MIFIFLTVFLFNGNTEVSIFIGCGVMFGHLHTVMLILGNISITSNIESTDERNTKQGFCHVTKCGSFFGIVLNFLFYGLTF